VSGSVEAVLVGAGAMLRGSFDGSVRPRDSAAPGLFVADTRLLSSLQLSLVGRQLSIASSRAAISDRTIVLLPIAARNETSDVILTLDQRVVSNGLEQSVRVQSTSRIPVTVTLRLEVGTDFADQFALRSDKQVFDRSAAIRSGRPSGHGIAFSYERQLRGAVFTSEVLISATGEPSIRLFERVGDEQRGTLEWTLQLDPGEVRTVEMSAHSSAAAISARALDRTPQPADALRDRSIGDIEALRMPCPGAPQFRIVAAGVPWFLTLFGRDSLIASTLMEPDLPGILDDTLRALAATQATVDDARRVAQPGKIVHELRVSELAVLDQIPYGRYYGSVDSTPLFLSGIAASGSPDVVRELEDSARKAVRWMLGPGGLREHGFLRYLPDPNGLIHQGWKDSLDAIAHADGTIATGAIALSEVQGYAWRALVDTARLADTVWADPGWAAELNAVASELKDRFRREFWMPNHDFPALAIDGDGRRVEVIASNAGHLLFSGILDDADARRVADRLLEADMFTGWGIRTLSSTAVRYHPLSYHNGSVWPHDTMLAAAGMQAYGFTASAHRVASGIADAAEHFDQRLPELFAGFARTDFGQPVAYAHAARPQAWAAAAGATAARLLRAQPRLDFAGPGSQ
jgi:glycogen debranching enzyme